MNRPRHLTMLLDYSVVASCWRQSPPAQLHVSNVTEQKTNAHRPYIRRNQASSLQHSPILQYHASSNNRFTNAAIVSYCYSIPNICSFYYDIGAYCMMSLNNNILLFVAKGTANDRSLYSPILQFRPIVEFAIRVRSPTLVPLPTATRRSNRADLNPIISNALKRNNLGDGAIFTSTGQHSLPCIYEAMNIDTIAPLIFLHQV